VLLVLVSLRSLFAALHLLRVAASRLLLTDKEENVRRGQVFHIEQESISRECFIAQIRHGQYRLNHRFLGGIRAGLQLFRSPKLLGVLALTVVTHANVIAIVALPMNWCDSAKHRGFG
jgi:hypothetical protein